MKNHILTLLFALVTVAVYPQKLVYVSEGYSQTSVNTTVFRNSSIATFKDYQYIAFYDKDGYMVVGKRKLYAGNKNNENVWTLSRSQYKGNVADAHNVISIMIDGDGYLHVSFDHHGHPLNYCRSIEPGGLKLGEKEPMTGVDESNVTYPEFYRMPNGDLLFAYRSGASGRGNLVLNKYSITSRKWSRVQDILIDGEGKRNAYWQLYVDEKGTIHVSWVWRESWLVETNHDLCYACSKDGGKTWYKSTGEKYTLPINEANAEYACRIPQNSELINQTSMSTDSEGNPFIVTYWRDADSEVPQYRMVWNDGKKWNQRQIMSRTQPFSLKGGGTKMIPISRPRIAVDKGEAFFIFRDAERGSKVSMAHTTDLQKGEWTVKDLTDFSVDAWEPSIDTELWKQNKELHIFVQESHQGDGEKKVVSEPTSVYVMEVSN